MLLYEVVKKVGFLYQIAQTFRFLVHSGVDIDTGHLTAMTHANLNLHIAVAALAGDAQSAVLKIYI